MLGAKFYKIYSVTLPIQSLSNFFDFISLEKGVISEEEIIKKLMYTFESYTNGGLTLIQEEMNENPNRFLQSTAFMNLLIPVPSETA